MSWEGGATTSRCVASLRAQERPPSEIVVVDNASSAAERERLVRELGGVPGVRLLLLDDNRQFAGGLNAGARAAFAAGAARALLLNNDTVLAADALGRLEDATAAPDGPGIAGPLVVDVRDPTHVITAGERVVLPLLCVPRTLLRYRARREMPYAVSGVMGCALLVTRECFEAVGGFAEEIQVYYEDVDFCLAAQEHGFGAVIVPRAVVRHDGMRGFAAGLTAWAAFLKARNPWLVVRRHGTPLTWLSFVPTYAGLVLASAAIYAARGRVDVVRALARGAAAGVAAALGARPVLVGPPKGRG